MVLSVCLFVTVHILLVLDYFDYPSGSGKMAPKLFSSKPEIAGVRVFCLPLSLTCRLGSPAILYPTFSGQFYIYSTSEVTSRN